MIKLEELINDYEAQLKSCNNILKEISEQKVKLNNALTMSEAHDLSELCVKERLTNMQKMTIGDFVHDLKKLR
jgi:hypothetical protein